MRRWPDVLWLLIVGVLSSAWCVTAAARLGATFDEPFYVASGLNAWRTGSNKPLMSAGTLPLVVDAQTLPVYLWERARGTPFHPYKELDVILPAARAANLVFWWGLLVYAMRLGRTWGGAWGGRIAVGLVGFDPNLLGHAALATTDISVVAMMLALVYHAHHGFGRGWWPRVFVPGACFGLATLAKASGMVFGVQALVVIGLWHLATAGALTPPSGTGLVGRAAHVWGATAGVRKDIAVSLLIGFVLVFAYTGCDWTVEPTFVTWAAGLPDGPVKDVFVPVSTNLRIFPNAGEALVQQVKHNLRGHGTYLLGEWHDRATPTYFPLALAMKTPLPALLLVLLTLALRPRAWNTPAGWFALLLLLFSLNCRVQIGVRFMFTLMAVAYVCAAAAVGRRSPEPPNPPGPPSLGGKGGDEPTDSPPLGSGEPGVGRECCAGTPPPSGEGLTTSAPVGVERSPEPPNPPGPPSLGGKGGDEPRSLWGASSAGAGSQEAEPTEHPSPSGGGAGGGVDHVRTPASDTVLRLLAGLLVAVTAAVSATAWPHGIGYFNRLWGDPAHGYTRLHDSNYDWGQGLPELKAWYAAHGGGRPLAVWYYGTDPDILYPPFRHVAVSHAKLTRGDQLPDVAGRGLLAVSVTSLYGNRGSTPSTRVASEWVLAREPVGRTQTFLIYDLSRE